MSLESNSGIKRPFLHEEFALGRKTISVDINLQLHRASIRFGSRNGLFINKIPGETTRLFLVADNLIQNVTNEASHAITLNFDTANGNLKLWARTKAPILGFDSIEPEDKESYRITVEKKYFPN